jgi:hypothetical protein
VAAGDLTPSEAADIGKLVDSYLRSLYEPLIESVLSTRHRTRAVAGLPWSLVDEDGKCIRRVLFPSIRRLPGIYQWRAVGESLGC